MRADLCAFRDLARFKTKLDSVGRSVGTRGPGIPFDVEFEPDDIERLTRQRQFPSFDGNRRRLLVVQMIDLVRHAPAGWRLDDIGKLLGQGKVKLPPGAITNMRQLRADDPDLYDAYARQDPLICAYFVSRLGDLLYTLFGSRNLPLTSSGVALKLFKKTLKENELDLHRVLGEVRQTATRYDEKRRGLRTSTEYVPVTMRSVHADFVVQTGHGGRGECMYVGPTPVGTYYDIDVASAYTTAMLALGLIDFDHPDVCLDPARYRGNVAGFALVRFSHDDAVRFPALPVYGSDDNLFFPRRGLSHCTAAEIEAAMNLGAEVEIVHGVIYPWLDEAVRPFEPFVRTIRDLRAQHPKGSFDNEFIKLVGNGLFGKSGQGLKDKKVFDTEKMRSVELEESEITNEVIFSFVTGFIRGLIAELMNGVPRHRRIVSATTDGFLCDCPLEEIDQSGPIATRFKALTALVSDKPILEVKHVVRQAISARIRAQFTAIPVPGEEIVLAKGNVTPEIELPDREIGKEEMRALQNAYMVDLYLNRTPDSQTMMRSFISVRQQWTDDLDVFKVEQLIRLNLEFDLKRQMGTPSMLAVADTEHIAFDTEPWDTVEQAEVWRTAYKGWRKRRCLKTLADHEDWLDFFGSLAKRRRNLAAGKAVLNRTAEGSVGIARRLFLRAYAQENWGLSRTLSYREMAEWLTAAGYETDVNDLKNARRSPLSEDALPATPAVMAFLALVQTKFPDIEVHRFVGGDAGPAS